MSLRQMFSPSTSNRKAKAHTSNVTTAPTHNLPGSDSARLPDETESSLSDTLGNENSSYSTHPSGNFKVYPLLICVNFYSILPDVC